MSFKVTYLNEGHTHTDLVDSTEVLDTGPYLKFYGGERKELKALYSAGIVIKVTKVEEGTQ